MAVIDCWWLRQELRGGIRNHRQLNHICLIDVIIYMRNFFGGGKVTNCCMHATVTFSDFSSHLINITADTLIIWEICRTTGWAWSIHLRLKYQQSPASYIHIYRFLGLMPNNTMQTWIWYRFMSYSKHRIMITKTFSNNK